MAIRRRIRRPSLRGAGGVLLTAVMCLMVLSCGRRGVSGELYPPSDAPKWETRFGVAFDDAYTRAAVNLEGRAPNDVLDQRLFAARLGHASVVTLVKVQQVWGRGRYQGRPEQFLDVRLDEVLMGELPGQTAEDQLLLVRSDDDLPGTLQGDDMILFLRWAPDGSPPYHHHLMPAEEQAVTYIQAMVKHAKKEGVLTVKGKERKGRQRRRLRKERRGSRKAARAGGK